MCGGGCNLAVMTAPFRDVNPLQMMKRIPWRKIVSSIGFLLLLLFTLLVLVVAWFSYQGRREWAETKSELLSRGELLSYEGLIPAPVPTEQNFFADPIWEPDAVGQIDLFAPQISPEEAASLEACFPDVADLVKEGNRWEVIQNVGRRAKDRNMTQAEADMVLAVLRPVQGDFDTLRTLAVRPEARFPVEYSKGISMELPHVHALFKAGLMLHRRAQAEAVLGQTDLSVDDILLIMRLAHTLDNEPVLISFLVAISLDSLALDAIEMLVPTWSATQVQRVERALGQSDVLEQMTKAFRGVRASGNQLMDQLKQASLGEFVKTLQLINSEVALEYPPPNSTACFLLAYRFAFLEGDRARLNQVFQRLLDCLEKESGLLRPHDFEGLYSDLEREMQGLNRDRYIVTYLETPALKYVFPKAASVETRVRQARIACAIQRYALSERALPSALDQLVPQYLERIPTDVINGGPMRYRSDGKEYMLWSAGWNEKDDGGEGSPNERSPEKRLDWVWKGRLPETFAVP